MNRAVLTEERTVLWGMVCHCQTLLFHKRATVFDEHFEDLETEVIEDYQDYEGCPFMEHLAEPVEARRRGQRLASHDHLRPLTIEFESRRVQRIALSRFFRFV
jgi:hypothetical protein